MEQIERIKTMEDILQEGKAAVAEFGDALEAFAAVQSKLQVLDAYYGSEDWLADFEADEAGKLPADLKRGVLSEDEAYDLLTDNRDLLVRMLEVASKMAAII